MKQSHFFIITTVVLLFLFFRGKGHQPSSAASPVPSDKATQFTGMANESSQNSDLRLPFEISNSVSKKFGLYPFGVKSTEHPAGHRGYNFEVKQGSAVLAPGDMQITKITSPAGRPDEHNVTAKALTGAWYYEFLRVGAVSSEVTLNSMLKTGNTLAEPGLNHSLGTYMFHFGILNDQGQAVCPDKSFWQPGAWQSLNQLLQTSIDDNGNPFTTLCTTNMPLAPSTDE